MNTALEVSMKFTFLVKGWAKNPFVVVRFEGEEMLSSLYHFTVTLACSDLTLDPATLLSTECRLRVGEEQSEQQDFHGLLNEVRLLSGDSEQIYLQVVLVPRVWALSQGCYCKIFLNQSIPNILKAVLEDQHQNGVLPSYQLKLTGKYEACEFICQYNESALQFISRLMEQQGLYYYFEQLEQEERLVITDHRVIHRAKPGAAALYYSADNSLELVKQVQVLKRWEVIHRALPRRVMLKGYNHERPAEPALSKAEVVKQGFGILYRYGEHFTQRREGDRLVQVCVEQLHNQGQYYEGESVSLALQPGYLFTLRAHFLSAMNRDYLCTRMVHEGDQSALVVTEGYSDRQPYYQNHFSAVAADSQYRAPRRTAIPRVIGGLTGIIDAAGSGKHAMLDKQGRYKVIFPFDLSGKHAGKASHWLRLAQPYGGKNSGMHFPLCKGTEVLITFINGDPDRPIIQSTLPNADNPSLVNESNAAINKLHTPGGNELCITDTAGRESITWSSAGGSITLGKI